MIDAIGKKIGEGGCAEVFDWGNEHKVIKLAKPNTSVDAMKAELHHSRVAWEIGLSVPQPFELVTIEGRHGIVFERIYGESILERFVKAAMDQTALQDGTNMMVDFDDVRITARLLHQIHAHTVSNMPNQRGSIKHDILRAQYLHAAEKEAAISLLERLPMKQQLCHGDPNPGNIMIRDNQAVIIDWTNASIGNPEADLAEYIVMMRYAVLPPHFPIQAAKILDSIREAIITVFMGEYERLSGIAYEDIDPWIIPIAARKLSTDACSEEKNLLVNEIRRRLHRGESIFAPLT